METGEPASRLRHIGGRGTKNLASLALPSCQCSDRSRQGSLTGHVMPVDVVNAALPPIICFRFIIGETLMIAVVATHHVAVGGLSLFPTLCYPFGRRGAVSPASIV